MRYRWAALALIVAVAAARVGYLAFWCPFDLSPDEAHYWDWSRQLDWCYYSKGPLVAWLIRASCAILGDTMLAVRLPAVLCGSLLLWGLHTLTMLAYRDTRLALAVVALALTLPIVAAGGLLMTIDAPFTCAWMWALVFAWRAVKSGADDARPAAWTWPAAGACILVGVLAKHTMILFVPSCALFLLTTPGHRHHLRRPGFWIMTGIGALGGAPILAWNAAHGWVSLRHSQTHAGLAEPTLQWLGPLHYLGGQGAILLGFWFALWLWTMWTHRPTREHRPAQRFLWWMSAPTFVFFALFSLKNGGGEPNWPVVAYLSGLVLAAGMFKAQDEPSDSWGFGPWPLKAAILGFAALGVFVTLAMHMPMTIQPVLLRFAGPATSERPMPMRRIDPTARLRGWRHLAAEVDRVRAELRGRGIEPVLATERWTQAGELAFYCDGQPQVHCLGVHLGDRDSQYDLWRPNPSADPALFEGRTLLLVGADVHEWHGVFDWVDAPRLVEYRENGVLIAQWKIQIAHGYRGCKK